MEIDQITGMSAGVSQLSKMSIAKLKKLMELLIKDKSDDSKEAIKIIKTLIDYKKGRINFIQQNGIY